MQQLDPTPDYKEPLSPVAKRCLLAAVIFFHVGGGWALTQIQPERIIAGEATPMQVSFVAAEPNAEPQPPQEEARPVEPEPTPEPPQLESMIQPPPPDLPPPDFPVPPPPPPKPKAAPPPKPRPQQAAPAPANPAPPAAAPSQITGPRTVTESQVAYIDRPNVIYPAKSRRAGEQGKVMLRVLIEPSGRPGTVQLSSSSGHKALDESAISAVRGARFKPYTENGIPQPVWVIVPINFVLQ